MTPDEANRFEDLVRGRVAATSNGEVESVRQAISLGTCDAADAWLYDKTIANRATANRICFTGGGQADLALYCRATFRGTCLYTWSGAVRSAWLGVRPGFFNYYDADAGTVSADPGCGNHAAGENFNTNACESAARWYSQ